MMNQVFENWSGMAKNNFRPIMEMGAMMTQMAEQMSRSNMQMACDCVGMGLKNYQNMASAKKPEDMLQAQAAVVCEAMEKSLKAMQTNATTLMNSVKECQEWSANNMGHQCQTANCCEPQQASSKAKKHQ